MGRAGEWEAEEEEVVGVVEEGTTTTTPTTPASRGGWEGRRSLRIFAGNGEAERTASGPLSVERTSVVVVYWESVGVLPRRTPIKGSDVET